MKKTIDLLGQSDHAFNPNDARDQYVKGFIEHGYNDIWKVNDFLEDKGLELLGI